MTVIDRALPRESATLVRRDTPRPDHWLFEPTERWIRAYAGDTLVVDSRSAVLVWEPRAKVPEYGYPIADVRTDLLVPGEPPTLPYYRPRRPARQWFDLVDGDVRIPSVAWTWDTDELDGFIALTWYPGILRWTEEDDTVFVHPRDPRNRVDALPSSRHIIVRSGDTVLAETRAAVIVYETGLPARYYVPRDDVRFETLRQVDGWSECPYKGYATDYWTLAGDDTEIAWSYPDPLPVIAPIAGRVAFYSERLSIEVDGVEVGVRDAA